MSWIYQAPPRRQLGPLIRYSWLARVTACASGGRGDCIVRSGGRAGQPGQSPGGVDRGPTESGRNQAPSRIGEGACPAATDQPPGWIDRRPMESAGNLPPRTNIGFV
jgi:hypothetical protein